MKNKLFWKLENVDAPGEWFYVKSELIIAVCRNDEGKPTIETEYSYFDVSESDYQKLESWADANSETVTEFETPIETYEQGGWR